MDRNLYPVRDAPSHRRGRRARRQGVRRGRRLRRAAGRAAAAPGARPNRLTASREAPTEDPCTSPHGPGRPVVVGCWRLRGAQHAAQRRVQLRPVAGRAQAPAPTPSSACRRSRRRPTQQQTRSKPPRAGALEAGRLHRRPRPARRPTCWCRSARASRATTARRGTTRSGGAAATATGATGGRGRALPALRLSGRSGLLGMALQRAAALRPRGRRC